MRHDRRAILLGLAASVGGLTLGPSSATAQGFPVRGRPIAMIVPFAAGGPTDIGARILAAFLEKELGTNVHVVNKPGATTQVGNTELFRAKPDGHTIAVVPPPSISVTYLDPERKAPYGRKDFQPIAHYVSDANLLVVPASSPFKTVPDLIAAATARPKQIKVGTSGLMGNTHLAGIGLEAATGAKFAFVHFTGAAPAVAAMLGGNLDVAINSIGPTLPHERAGNFRVLGSMDSKQTSFFPGVRTLREQGIDVFSPTSFAVLGPAGIPAEIVQALAGAVRRSMEQEAFKTKIHEVALVPDYMDPEQLAAFWADTEQRMKQLLAMAKQRQE